VVTPFTGALNLTACSPGATINHGSIEYVAKDGCLISVGEVADPIGSVIFQLVRLRIWEGKVAPEAGVGVGVVVATGISGKTIYFPPEALISETIETFPLKTPSSGSIISSVDACTTVLFYSFKEILIIPNITSNIRMILIAINKCTLDFIINP
jgi:hypothetical protein